MSRSPRWLGFGGAVALAAACGGQSFTTAPGETGDGATVVTDGAMVPVDGPDDTTASDAVSQADATSDAFTLSDSTSGGDGAMDAGPKDAFVPDVIEEPPPHCNGAFQCVPSVPPGWSGPFELYSGSGANPPCSANFAGPAYNGNGGNLVAMPAVCKCLCGGAAGVGCSVPPLSFYANALLGTTTTCSTANLCADIALMPGVCTEIDVLSMCPSLKPTTAEMTVAASEPTGGTCAPQASLSVTPYTWGLSARACVSSLAPAQLDCAAGSVCAPQTASPFGSALCISQPGAVACPASGYSTGTTFYGGVADGRTCTSCTCGSVTGAQCSATVVVSPSTDGTCTTGADQYGAPVTCAGVQQPGDYQLNLATTSTGSCTPNPVASAGAATPSSPTTFCCLP